MGWNENHSERLYCPRHSICSGEKVKSLASKTELLQIPIWLLQTLKQGKVSIQTDGTETLLLKVENNTIDLNFIQKELIKDILDIKAEIKKESILKRLETLRNLAEKLKQDGFTVTISHKGQTVLTLGSGAHPKKSQMVTGTKAIEINNLIELIKLFK